MILGDPAYEMYRQATLGDVEFITGDYLAGISTSPIILKWIPVNPYSRS